MDTLMEMVMITDMDMAEVGIPLWLLTLHSFTL
jgi:hypothetical protein